MTTTSNISFLGQSQTQVNRLNDLRATLDDLQRQATTQKKFENFSGFGTDALNLQRLHNSSTLKQAYVSNIDAASNRMTLMNTSMTEIIKVGQDIITTIQNQAKGGQPDMQLINQQARQGLSYVESLLNQTIDGRYIFGGSDVTTPPYSDENILNTNFNNQISSWLGGGITNAQLTATTDAFTASNLGLSGGLGAAGNVTTRIDDNLDLDYTIKADDKSITDILNTLGYAANLKYPDPLTDVASPTQFNDLIDHILSIGTGAVDGLNSLTQTLASKFNLVKSIRETHTSDLGLVTTQIDKLENADPTNVIATMQLLQTQLQASYQVTRQVSQMSLVNFLN